MRLRTAGFICIALCMIVLSACGISVEVDRSQLSGLYEEANNDAVASVEDDIVVEDDGEVEDGEAIEALGKLTVHFIDVGQGDATLIQAPDFTMLIDAGRHDRSEVVPYLEQAGVEHIDILVGTHPHADHIGQMDKVIQRFPVEEVWMSGDTHTSRTFERVLDAILDSGANYVEPRAGDVFQIGDALVTILNPDELTGDLNGGSIVMHFAYGEMALMLTGDAEAYQEDTMIGSDLPLQAQILKLGHHGSSTSSTQPFIENVLPELAIYSAGADNSYGHPHDEVIERLERMNIPVYGTDDYGTLIIETDGITYELIY